MYRRSLALQLLSLSALSDAFSLPQSFDSNNALQRPLTKQTNTNVRIVQEPINSKLAADDLPEIDSEALQNDISADALLQSAKDLFKIAETSFDEFNHPTRVIGSPGHAGTLVYVNSVLTSLNLQSAGPAYYTLSNQSFPAVFGEIYDFRLVLGSKIPASARPMGLTPPTPKKEAVFAPLVLVDNEGCDEDDYPDTVTGNIALVKRGVCAFGTKSELAGKAGALAAVVFNYEDGPVSGTLGSPNEDYIATFGVSGHDIKPVLAELAKGNEVDASAYIDSTVGTIQTTNIIAQTTGGDQENCVMLGGHSDSVTEGPGINDDGTGSLTLLEIAKRLTKYKVNNCVRFAWWAGEEEGLLGSDYYVEQLSEEENLKIRLFMDYDMLASPNYAYQVYNATDALNPVGSQALRDLYTTWYEKQGLNWTYIPFDGRSDYDAFIKNGIPGGGIATGAEGIKTKKEQEMFGGNAGQWYDPCYHQLCDDVGNVNMTAWEVNAKLVAHSVATYAKSFEGYPKRTLESVAAKSVGGAQEFKYHGSKLIM